MSSLGCRILQILFEKHKASSKTRDNHSGLCAISAENNAARSTRKIRPSDRNMSENMTGIGTIINTICIVSGGLVGNFIGKLFDKEQQDALTKTCGVSVLFIAIAGTMEGMLKIENNAIISGKAMLVVLCLALGTTLGELLRIERGLERFGEWLKNKTGNSKDK